MAVAAVPHPASVVELASGVDALYLSGRADLSDALFEVLDERRAAAIEAEAPVPFEVAGEEFLVEPRSFGIWLYRLLHPYGLIGVTRSDKIPAIRVQPRAEFLHAVGPRAVLSFFERVGEFLAGGPVEWKLSRLDLFCDVQGWDLAGDDRRRFVCRAKGRDLHEHDEAFGGFEFGRRKTGTLCARIYDKTLQVEKKGIDWWPEVWGERYDRSRRVLRVEVEIGRNGLREFQINAPTQGLDQAPRLWAAFTENWLSYRDATDDGTKARWPIAPEWTALQQASLRGEAISLDRVRAGVRKGSIRRLTPPLVGYLSSAAALLGTHDVVSTMAAVRWLVERDQRIRGLDFVDRIAERKARELWL